MKRNISRYQVMPFSGRLVRSNPSHDFHALRFPSASGQSRVRARNIFVIKQTTRLSPASAADKQIQRILIFDDHPDSLSLVLARRLNRSIYRPARDGARARHFILPGIAIIVALLAMFWPLF
jgi:hypothetical protein